MSSFPVRTYNDLRNSDLVWYSHNTADIEEDGCYPSIGDQMFIRKPGTDWNWSLYEVGSDCETLISVRDCEFIEAYNLECAYHRNEERAMMNMQYMGWPAGGKHIEEILPEESKIHKDCIVIATAMKKSGHDCLYTCGIMHDTCGVTESFIRELWDFLEG
jgi:hypothetical protein